MRDKNKYPVFRKKEHSEYRLPSLYKSVLCPNCLTKVMVGVPKDHKLMNVNAVCPKCDAVFVVYLY